MATHYKILGVEQDATAEEIKKAWRKIARTTHPDTASSAGAEHIYIVAQEAYETLSDPGKRATYDRGLKRDGAYSSAPPPPPPPSPPPTSEPGWGTENQWADGRAGAYNAYEGHEETVPDNTASAAEAYARHRDYQEQQAQVAREEAEAKNRKKMKVLKVISVIVGISLIPGLLMGLFDNDWSLLQATVLFVIAPPTVVALYVRKKIKKKELEESLN